jgi:hypothetical protein
VAEVLKWVEIGMRAQGQTPSWLSPPPAEAKE